MIKYYRDPFDTAILGNTVYKVIVSDDESDPAELSAALDRIIADTIFCFVPFSDAAISVLEQAHFHLASIRATYQYAGDRVSNETTVPENLTFSAMSHGLSPIAADGIRSMAAIIGATSHYWHDQAISREAVITLYSTWIINSLYRGYADEVFIILEGKILAGLVTIKIKDDAGSIDLVGVKENYRDRGLGKMLLMKAIWYLQNKGVHDIRVVTEAENIAATVFYQKNGFRPCHIEAVYHKHAISTK